MIRTITVLFYRSFETTSNYARNMRKESLMVLSLRCQISRGIATRVAWAIKKAGSRTAELSPVWWLLSCAVKITVQAEFLIALPMAVATGGKYMCFLSKFFET